MVWNIALSFNAGGICLQLLPITMEGEGRKNVSRYDKEEGVGKTAAIDGIGGIVLLFAAVKGEKGNNRQEGEKKGRGEQKKGCRV